MLLDTSIFIDFFRGNKESLAFFQSRNKPASKATDPKNKNVNKPKLLYTSSLVIMELIVGLPTKNKIPALERFLHSAGITVLPVDAETSIMAYELMKQHFHATSIGIPDALIAATSLRNNLPLMTHNAKHFQAVADLELVKPYTL